MSPNSTAVPRSDHSLRRWGSPGAWAWLLVVPVFLLAQLVAAAGWTTPYSWSANNISDLGALGCGSASGDHRYICSPRHASMNAGFAITGVLIVLGVVSRWRCRDGLRGRSRIFVLVTGAAYVMVGLAPADRHENVHVVLGALPIFVLGNAGLLLVGLRRRDQSARRRGAALVMGAVGLIATVLFAGGHDLGLGMGGMERVVVWPLLVFLSALGVSSMPRRRQGPGGFSPGTGQRGGPERAGGPSPSR